MSQRNDSTGTDEPFDPAQARLLTLLAELQDSATTTGPHVERLLRAVRWERNLRSTAVAVGDLAAALANGLTLLLRRDAVKRS